MKSSNKLDATAIAELQGERIPFEDLAKSQWALIHDLERQYQGKLVHGTNCKFEDDVWISGDGKGYHTPVYWRTVLPGARALTILTKVISFDVMSSKRLEVASLKGILYNQKKSIISLIETKNLLSGSDGDYLLGLNNLTDEDLLVTLDALLGSAASEKAFWVECTGLEQFITLANHIAESVPVYQIRARLPWQKSGISIRAWAHRRAADLGEIFRAVEGFEPMPAETTMPLIEKSLTLIDDYSDHFAAIGSLVASYVDAKTYSETYDSPSVGKLLKKYIPIFGHLVAPPEISELNAREEISAVFSWLRELLYLARGAAVNVILLTTGLRNSDVRGLQVGACTPSKRIDMLFYLRVEIQKTKNLVLLPVPGQTEKAISLLEKIKFTKSSCLIDGSKLSTRNSDATANNKDDSDPVAETRVLCGEALNSMVRDFAAHFNIPFSSQRSGDPYSLHCYRTTVAGWLGAASNLSVLLVRRLFGHSNDVMPTVYLRNNPAFIEEQKAEKARAASETARQMALAASNGQLAGNKGDQLERGFKQHVSRFELDKGKSHSLTDAELVLSFANLIEQRILNESVCGFMTPFGVRCMRNPADTTQPPCAKRSHSDKTKDVDQALLNHLSDIDPQNCIGTSCGDAMIGPWSESIKESLLWYAQLLRHQLGDKFTDEHFRAHAKQFISQYGAPIKKVFGIEVRPNGSVAHRESDRVEL